VNAVSEAKIRCVIRGGFRSLSSGSVDSVMAVIMDPMEWVVQVQPVPKIEIVVPRSKNI